MCYVCDLYQIRCDQDACEGCGKAQLAKQFRFQRRLCETCYGVENGTWTAIQSDQEVGLADGLESSRRTSQTDA